MIPSFRARAIFETGHMKHMAARSSIAYELLAERRISLAEGTVYDNQRLERNLTDQYMEIKKLISQKHYFTLLGINITLIINNK